MNEQKVKLVMGLDGRPTGEAYVEISGPGAKYRLALAKDRQLMPVSYAALPNLSTSTSCRCAVETNGTLGGGSGAGAGKRKG